MDGPALAALARAAAAHSWTFTRHGLDDVVEALGWDIVGRQGARVDLRTGGSLEPAWAMFLGDELVSVECSLVLPVEVDPEDDDAVEDVEVQMYDLFEEAADCVEAAIGKPDFRDGRASPRFPADEEGAEWLAAWTTDAARLSVKQLHEDQGLPYRLSFVVEGPG